MKMPKTVIASGNDKVTNIATTAVTSPKLNRIEPQSEASEDATFSALPLIGAQRYSEDEDLIEFEVSLYPEAFPPSLRRFCEDIQLDEAVVVKHLLIDSYKRILRDLSEKGATARLFRNLLKTQFILGKASLEHLERAKLHGWLNESDIVTFKRLKQTYPELSDE